MISGTTGTGLTPLSATCFEHRPVVCLGWPGCKLPAEGHRIDRDVHARLALNQRRGCTSRSSGVPERVRMGFEPVERPARPDRG